MVIYYPEKFCMCRITLKAWPLRSDPLFFHRNPSLLNNLITNLQTSMNWIISLFKLAFPDSSFNEYYYLILRNYTEGK